MYLHVTGNCSENLTISAICKMFVGESSSTCPEERAYKKRDILYRHPDRGTFVRSDNNNKNLW